MSKSIYLLFFLGVLLTGCVSVSPQNLHFDSAKMMESGTLEFQGNGSVYTGADNPWTHFNLGGKVGIGFTDRYNIKLRYEAMMDMNSTEFNWHYAGFDNKIGITKWFAVSLPIGWYISKEMVSNGGTGFEPEYDRKKWGEFKPAFYFTATFDEQFELTFIPKWNFLFRKDHLHDHYPALSICAGFSTDLNQWAIRPEVGLDPISGIGFGVGFSYYVGFGK